MIVTNAGSGVFATSTPAANQGVFVGSGAESPGGNNNTVILSNSVLLSSDGRRRSPGLGRLGLVQ